MALGRKHALPLTVDEGRRISGNSRQTGPSIVGTGLNTDIPKVGKGSRQH